MQQRWTKANWAQRKLLIDTLEAEPYTGQWDIVKCDTRLRIAAGGERAGKSFISALDLTSRLPWGREFWIVGPDYYLPRAEFEYIQTFLWGLGAIRSKVDINTPKEGSWSLVTKSGQLVVTRTSSDVRKLAARSVSGILMVEAGQQDYSVLLKCIGRVSQERGWILASGTFESSFDWFALTFAEWQNAPEVADGVAFSLPTWDNVYEFPGGREDPEILNLEKLYEAIPGYFMEKCGAVPAPPLGVIFRAFSFVHNVRDEVRFNENLPVYLGIDPAHGGPGAYAIAAVQFVADPGIQEALVTGTEVADPIDVAHVVDVIYVPGAAFEDILPIVRNKAWIEHVIGGAIDVESPDERKRWRRFLGIPLVAKKVPILEGERRLQTFLHRRGGKFPHLLFSTDCPAVALKEFVKYRSAVTEPEDLAHRPPTAAKQRRGPEHLLKALWYLLYARYGPVKPAPLRGSYVRATWRRLQDAFTGR